MDSSLFKKFFRGAALMLLLLPLGASAWIRSPATTFAVMPEGATNPEGIAVGPAGDIYVSTFAVGGTDSGVGEIFIFNPGGEFIRKVAVAGSSTLLLELGFHPFTGDLLVIDFGNQQVLDVDPVTGTSSIFATIPGGAAAGPNVLTFDSAGNVYISDSFQGIIWMTDQNGSGGIPSIWVQDPLLTTSGVPPFGANGIAFNNDESAMFVSNTGNDTVVKVPVDATGNAGVPEVFVNSVNGADGLIIDEDDNLWIAANQSDEIVVVDPGGRAIAKLGDFGGLTRRGAPIGLLFPASLVRHGKHIYVTNLALDLRLFGLAPPLNAIWSGEVTSHTISRIRARIPPVNGLP
ncbi:MAG TPA: SMP-30/gluconolactonase/LRE family protein [Gammaproteobacteria bacterium]|nr:SMP-30/gluconolactonase/LRE family protein [Gammaproteobacteria bacterium]